MFLRLISTFQKTSLSCQHLSILYLYLIYSQYHIVNSRFSEIFPYLYSSYIQLSSIKKNNKSKEKKNKQKLIILERLRCRKNDKCNLEMQCRKIGKALLSMSYENITRS